MNLMPELRNFTSAAARLYFYGVFSLRIAYGVIHLWPLRGWGGGSPPATEDGDVISLTACYG